MSKRLKVCFGETKLLLSGGDTNETVEGFLHRASKKFASTLGHDELSFVTAKTSDGFLFDNNDLLSEVIDSGDVICVLDRDTWLNEEEKKLGYELHKIYRTDFLDEISKILYIGLHKDNKLYAAAYKGNKIYRLGLCSYSSMKNPKKSFKETILSFREENPDDRHIHWSVEAVLDVRVNDEALSKGGTPVEYFVELSTKSFSDPQEEKYVVELAFKSNKLEIVKATLKQSPFKPVNKRYTVPDPTSSGPNLEALILQEQNEPISIPFEGIKSEGESPLLIEQLSKIYPTETWKHGDVHYNDYMFQVRFTNRDKDPLCIVKAESQYKNKNGEWIPCPYTLIGHQQGYYNYSWIPTPYNIEIKNTGVYALRAQIDIKSAPQTDRNRRVHPSLPNPLELRFVLSDLNGKSTTLSTKATHEDSVESMIQKRSKQEEKAGKTYDWWTQCDDTNAITRLWVGGRHNKEEHRLELETQGSSNYISEDTLYKAAFDAKKEKKSEISLDWPSVSSGDIISTQVFAVVDLEEQATYALHIQMKTSTSTYDAYKLVPSPF